MDNISSIALFLGPVALFGMLLDQMRRKNIRNPKDGILSVILFSTYFLVLTLVIGSGWTTMMPYLLSAAGYIIITIVVFFLRKRCDSKGGK